MALVRPLALASLAAGADGLLIEVHPDPARALCDGPQSLNPKHFSELMSEVAPLCPYWEKRFAGGSIMKITAYLGPQGTYSEEAAIILPDKSKAMPPASFSYHLVLRAGCCRQNRLLCRCPP